jgi:hypothetical protein
MGLINKFTPEQARAAGLKSAEKRKLKKLAKEQSEKEFQERFLRAKGY